MIDVDERIAITARYLPKEKRWSCIVEFDGDAFVAEGQTIDRALVAASNGIIDRGLTR